MVFFRHLESIGRVYSKDLVVAERLNVETAVHKEKKKVLCVPNFPHVLILALDGLFRLHQGIFSSVLKDMKGTKATHGPEMEAEDAEGAEALSSIFTVANFPLDVENTNNQITDDTDEVELLDIGIPPLHHYYVVFVSYKQDSESMRLVKTFALEHLSLCLSLWIFPLNSNISVSTLYIQSFSYKILKLNPFNPYVFYPPL